MKRLITTYVVSPQKLDQFVQASEEFASQTHEQDKGVIEFNICRNLNTVTHYISFNDEHAQQGHRKAPRTQIFLKLTRSMCTEEPKDIHLPEHDLKTGIYGTSPEQERKEVEVISLYKNQEEIEKVLKED